MENPKENKVCPFMSRPNNNGVDSFIDVVYCVEEKCMAWIKDKGCKLIK